MSWYDSTIWWQVYPLGATGAPIRPTASERAVCHRLRHLHGWLDYAIELGANGLALGPVFTADTHGYDTLDHFSIDPRLGVDGDFDALVSACRERGIHVLLDGVFNHVGSGHPVFQAALRGGPEAAEAGMFRIDWSDREPRYDTFEGHQSLVALNHQNPRVEDLVVDVMRHWLRRGAAGWRLDVAYAVPASFWAAVLPRVRAEFPEAWFVGEVIHGDYTGFVESSGLDSLTQYELWKAIWSSLLDRNLFELDWSLRRHNAVLQSFTPMTFVGNHDVTRIASKVGPEMAALAHLILLTVGGIPSLYYGDERGFRGTKTEQLGGDDEVRPMLPDDPTGLDPAGEPMLRFCQRLIALRRRHPWLTTARTDTVHLDQRSYTYDAVGGQGQRLRVELTMEPDLSARVSSAGETLLGVEGRPFLR